MADFDLVFGEFQEPDNLLHSIKSPQADYLRCYLIGLQARHFILESAYFDRDYLAEFAAYYSTSAQGYRNYCQRIHFFSGNYSKELFEAALREEENAIAALNATYLGFIVIRPIPVTQIGRTVLKWYPNLRETDRVVAPSREYPVHIAGVPLTIYGLAWQQQDAAVAACATVGLWSILHSSAFDDSHFVPTTVEITRAAEGFGSRTFPSIGLAVDQIQEAIKQLRLAPILKTGNTPLPPPFGLAFSKSDFASVCASFIRSGFPVLLCCDLLCKDKGSDEPVLKGKHAVCAVGFRECGQPTIDAKVRGQDAEVATFYIHDDNIGPSVRFSLIEQELSFGQRTIKVAALERQQPDYLSDDKKDNSYRILIPSALIIAVHENFRVSHTAMAKFGDDLAKSIQLLHSQDRPEVVIDYSVRYFRLADYLRNGVGKVLKGKPQIAQQVRLSLSQLKPLSLIIGVIRLSVDNEPLADIILDTTDGDHRLMTFAHVVYQQNLDTYFQSFDQSQAAGAPKIHDILKLGPSIKGY